MKKSLTTHEAKTHLSKIIEDVLAGAEVVICRGKSPVVKVVRYFPDGEDKQIRPKVGEPTSGKVRYSDDAFSPITAPTELDLWGMK